MSTVIGRKQEIEELERLYNSDRPEFVADMAESDFVLRYSPYSKGTGEYYKLKLTCS